MVYAIGKLKKNREKRQCGLLTYSPHKSLGSIRGSGDENGGKTCAAGFYLNLTASAHSSC